VTATATATETAAGTTAVPQLDLDGQAAAPEGPVDVAAMYVMHRAFRRDLDAFVGAVPRVDPADRRRWTRMARRFTFFAAVLHKHHHGEDVGLWPLLAERGADPAALEALAADHTEVDTIVQAVAGELRVLADGAGGAVIRDRVIGAIEQLRDALSAHLAREELDGMALVQQHLTQQDWDRLDDEVFSKDYTPREVPAVLGWVTSGLPPEVVQRIPGGDSPLFRGLGRLAAWRFDRREARTFGTPAKKARKDRILAKVGKYVGAAHARVLRATGWRVGARWMGGDVLLLTHTGRRSQRAYTTPLLHVRDGDDLVVAASNGGIDHEPQWWLNLQADPRGVVEVGGDRTPIRASQVTTGDRERLWAALMAKCSNYDGYQATVSRQISVVRLTPTENA
jgi:deazaflavin-dependent oxidoreductase (nitroreductase family)